MNMQQASSATGTRAEIPFHDADFQQIAALESFVPLVLPHQIEQHFAQDELHQ